MAEEKYDQEFFLALAAKGKDEWNVWRRDPNNKPMRVTFASVDFSEAPKDQIDFSGFEFGDDADFSGCKWLGVKYGDILDDVKTFKPGRALFVRAAFGARANFTGAIFGNSTSFIGATFGDYVNFDGATFGIFAVFDLAVFGFDANFHGAVFGNGPSFDGAAFNSGAKFTAAVFEGFVKFKGMSAGQWHGSFQKRKIDQEPGDIPETTARMERDPWKSLGVGDLFGPDHFLSISFASARFDREAVFADLSFESIADFTNARFYWPPNLDAATKVHQIDFTGARVGFVPASKWLHLTEDSRIPVRLRALRKIAEKTKNHDLERDLYIEERKAERGVYWHQLSDELKRAPEELKKQLVDITKQKKDVWSEWRLQVKARIAHLIGIAVNRVRLAVHGLWIVLMFLYWALSDYGRNVVVPFMWWLVFTFLIFPQLYAALLDRLKHEAGLANAEKYNHAEWMLA